MQRIDIIRLSEKQKQQLIFLKRKTGIENWNVLCRWALCVSLADSTVPPKEDIPSDSNVEMTWKTLGGDAHEVYLALLFYSFKSQEILIEDASFINYLKLHLNRGIYYLTKSNLMN
jgi:DNA sulfur modification protein DndE